MPTDSVSHEDIEDAKDLAKWLGICTKRVNIHGICKAFSSALKCDTAKSEKRIPVENVIARVRVAILYYYAERMVFI